MTTSAAPTSETGTAPAGVTQSPVPGWVEWLDVAPPPPVDSPPPVAVLLLDWQRNTPARATFHRRVRQLNTDAALQANAQVEIEFSPSLQSLEIHHLTVLRDGAASTATEHADPDQVRLIQREANLERHAYDDRVTAALHLEDLRPGDVLDVAYTIHDVTLKPEDGVALRQPCEWEFTVARFHFAVTFPAELDLRFRSTHRSVEPPANSESGGLRTLVWERHRVAPVAAEERTPAWVERRASIELSSFPTWEYVASHLAQQWGNTPTPGPGLAEKIEEIKRTTTSDENRILLALRFVQNEIRTAGVPFGCAGFSPSSPESVFARRFGDSRDKANLLCAMLGACGVGASPAAVSTRHRDRLATLLPSPGLFDHVIVRVRTSGGFAWVDPTLPDQAGNLRFRSLPDYKSALVIAPETVDLCSVDSSSNSRERIDVGERFVLGLRSFEPSVLVTTRLTGARADELRHQVRILGLDGACAKRATRYADQYPGAEHSAAPELHEEQHGESAIVLNEQLILPEFGVLTDEGRAVHFTCTAHAVSEQIALPTARSRNTPFAIPFPARVTHQIEIEAPGARDLKPDAQLVENDFFRFSSTTSTTLKGARLQFSYEALTDHIPPAGFRRYSEDIAKVADLLKFELTIPLLRGFPFRQKISSPLEDEGAADAITAPKSSLANRKTGLVAPLRRKPHQDESYLRSIDDLIDDDHRGDADDATASTTTPLEQFPRSPDADGDPGTNHGSAAPTTRAPALRESKNANLAAPDDTSDRSWNRSDHHVSLVNVFGVLGAIVVAGVLVAAFTGYFSPDEVTVDTGASNPLVISDQRFIRAAAEIGAGEFAIALATLDELDTEFPLDDDITVARGLAHLELGAVEEALQCSAAVLDRHPAHPEALTLHGRVSHALGRIEEARAILERSLTIDPEQIPALRALGDLYFEFGDLVKAEKAYGALLARVPDEVPAIVKLATLHDRAGNTFTAREVFLEARNANPNNIELALAHARFLSSHDDHHTAIHEAEKALAIDPDRRATLAAIADLYRAAGDQANAKFFEERAEHAKE